MRELKIFELRPPRNTPAISAGETACFVPPGCARRETRASNVAMSFAKECHGKTHRYIRSTKTQNALPESKREFPPYPSVASDGGDENAPSHLGYSSKTIPRERCYTTAGAVLGGSNAKLHLFSTLHRSIRGKSAASLALVFGAFLFRCQPRNHGLPGQTPGRFFDISRLFSSSIEIRS